MMYMSSTQSTNNEEHGMTDAELDGWVQDYKRAQDQYNDTRGNIGGSSMDRIFAKVDDAGRARDFVAALLA